MTKVPEGKKNEDGESKAAAGPSVTEEVAGDEEKAGKAGPEAAAGPPGPDSGKRERDGQPEGGREDQDLEAGLSPRDVTLEERIHRLTEEKEELQDRFVRLMADFENFKKRANREKSDIIQFGNEGLLRDILPIIDTIERLRTYSYQEGSWKNFQEGIELLLSEISRMLGRYGVEEIHALGQPFDPSLHEAMQRSETDREPPNTVLEVLQKGYTYRGKLLRPSLVVVSAVPEGKGAESGPAEGEGDSRGGQEREQQQGKGDGNGDGGEESPVQ